MGKNNNKLLSLFLLASIVTTTSIFSGILSISKERYERSEADAITSYKTVYLYVPNDVLQYNKADPENPDPETAITWDEVDSQVTIYDKTAAINKYPVMTKIQTSLYSFTLANTNNNYYFKKGSSVKSSTDVSPLLYANLDRTTPMIQMAYYNAPEAAVGSWYNPAATGQPLHSASAYANAFVKVLRNDPCKNDGSSDYLKVKDVWKGLESIYSGLDDGDKSFLASASIEGEDITNHFAALYDHIYHRYGNYDGFGTNFAGRSVSALPASRYTPTSISEMDTSNLIIAISSGLAVISITGLYFYIRKRKQD